MSGKQKVIRGATSLSGPEILELMDRVKKMEPVFIPKPLKKEIEKRAKRTKVTVGQYLGVLLDVHRPAKAR